MRNIILFFVLLNAAIIFSGCNFDTDDPATPTVEVLTPVDPLPQATDTPSPTPTPSPTITQDVVANIVTQVPTATPPPTETDIPTATPGPWVWIVRPDDTIGFIIQQAPHNYPYDPAVIEAVVILNENIPNADTLPPVGEEILIPRPTPIPIITSIEVTPSDEDGAPAENNNPAGDRRVSSAAVGEVGCHEVRDGETVVDVISQYPGMTLEIFSQYNGDTLNFSGCNFELPAGGPNCNPIIQTGQCVDVLLPTPTPTLSPTPSGNETPTLTPTPRAPNMISPPNDSTVSAGPVTLYWDSVGVLRPEEYYLVQITDLTTGSATAEITKATALIIDAGLIPSDGQTHDLEWSVMVAVADANGAYAPAGDPGEVYSFRWQSR